MNSSLLTQVKETLWEDIEQLLLAYSGIFFSRSLLFGSVIFGLTFWVPNLGIHGVLAGVIGTLIIRCLRRLSSREMPQVLIVNSILMGLFEGALFKLSGQSLLVLGVLCLNTTFIFLLLDSILTPRELPLLSIPFSLSASLFLASLFRLDNLEWSYPYHWETSRSISLEIPFVDTCLKSIASIIFLPNVTVGLLILVAMFLYSRIQVLTAIVTLLASNFIYSVFMTNSSTDTYSWSNFNLVLFGLSMGGFFLSPGLVSLGLSLLAMVFCFFSFQFFLLTWKNQVEWIHSLPYALCCLFALVITRRHFPKLINSYLGVAPELGMDLNETRKRRFGQNAITLQIPFRGKVDVLQGFHGSWTHQGAWRYSIDFIRKNQEGQRFQKDPSQRENYFIWGESVLAPCYGWITSFENQVEDRKIGFLDHEKNWGNFVILRNEIGVYILLAHLKEGSIRVKVGDYVRPGDVIAEVGNSGYSHEPHLHLHVQKTAAIGSDTLPFCLEPYQSKQKIHFYTQPRTGDSVQGLPENKALQFALNFKAGDQMLFEKRITKGGNNTTEPTLEKIQVKLEPKTGKWIFEDSRRNRLYFWRDSKHFYFYDLFSDGSGILPLLVAAFPMVPLTYGSTFKWNDYLPAIVRFHGLHRVVFEILRFLGIPDRKGAARYQMSADGMCISGCVRFRNQWVRSRTMLEPGVGLRSIQVGNVVLERLNQPARENPALKDGMEPYKLGCEESNLA